ncbi:tRNA (adenine-N1)-methyltransferase [Candidatus Undinarchaeota archaeon]
MKIGDWIVLAGPRRYVLKLEKKKFSTQHGEIDLAKLVGKKFGTRIKSHMGVEFVCFEARQPDLLRKIKRMPQIVTFKDAGIIASYTGLNKEDVVIEAGTGSAALCIFMSGIAKKIYTHEIREDFFEGVKKNLEMVGAKNVVLRNKDITKGVREKCDVFVLDMGSPELAIDTVKKSLKPGGFLVVYSPVIEQVQRVYKVLDEGFTEIRTKEIIEREWDIGNNKTRPMTQKIGHTAFLTFARKT